MPRGGKRPGAGRPFGSSPGAKPTAKGKARWEMAEIARAYGPDAIECLKRLMTSSKNEGTRLNAAREILDRGYGKPDMNVSQSGNVTITHEQALIEIEQRVNGALLVESDAIRAAIRTLAGIGEPDEIEAPKEPNGTT